MTTITINLETKLVLAKNAKSEKMVYNVVTYGWETGMVVEVPFNASPAEVVEAYLG